MSYAFASIAQLPPEFWRWPHLSPEEWRCSMTGRLLVVPEFMEHFEQLRGMFGKPIPVSSGFRSPEYNEQVSATQSTDGAHTLGLAVDGLVHGAEAMELLHLALGLGWTGVGIQQKGPVEKRFIHLDMAPAREDAPRPWLWTY